MFDKVDSIREYGGAKYLVLFGSERYDAIFHEIRYLIGLKSKIKYIFSHNYAKIKIDSDNDLPRENIFYMHNAAMLILSVFIKNQNHYHYNLFSEKCLHQLA